MSSLALTSSGLPFRGNRDYLHSTDLFPALTEFAKKQFSPEAFIECLTIRQVARHQVRVDFDKRDGAFGNFRVRNGMDQNKGWLVETDEPVCSRIAFDEDTPAQSAVSGPGFARFEKLLPKYSTFELLVILTKILSAQQSNQHWWICQIEFQSPLRETIPLECRFSRKISQRYLTLHIYQAGKVIGSASGIANSISNLNIQWSKP